MNVEFKLNNVYSEGTSVDFKTRGSLLINVKPIGRMPIVITILTEGSRELYLHLTKEEAFILRNKLDYILKTIKP